MDDAELVDRARLCDRKVVRIKVHVLGIPAAHDDALTRCGPRRHRDIGVHSIDTGRVVGAVEARAADFDIGQCRRYVEG